MIPFCFYYFKRFFFFLMWVIIKISTEFVTILLLVSAFVFGLKACGTLGL